MDRSDIHCDDIDLTTLISSTEVIPVIEPPRPLVQEDCDIVVNNVGDWLIAKADMTVTPGQRFWVCEVIGVSRRHIMPENGHVVPEDEPNGKRWLRVW